MERRPVIQGVIDRVIRRPEVPQQIPGILSQAEMAVLIDGWCRDELDMGLEEFAVRLYDGTAPNTSNANHLAVLAGFRRDDNIEEARAQIRQLLNTPTSEVSQPA